MALSPKKFKSREQRAKHFRSLTRRTDKSVRQARVQAERDRMRRELGLLASPPMAQHAER